MFLNESYSRIIMADKTAKQGDTVSVEYEGRLETGELFDTSKGKDPLEFEIGSHKVIKGFEEGVVGMKISEEKEININPEDGYGNRNENYVKEVPKNSIPKSIELKQGMLFMFKREDGMSIPATVTEIKDDIVKVDFNHPLSGKKLKFKVKLVDIK